MPLTRPEILRLKVRSTEEAFAWCRRLARTHYENFPVASWLVPQAQADALWSIYAFARTADDLADEPGYAGQRLKLLNRWGALLRQCARRPAPHPVFRALGASIRRHRLPIVLLEDLLRAFRQDVTVRRYRSFADVLRYCRYSADPVGRLYLILFGIRTPRLLRMSDAICTALQLANFWQDIPADLDKGRIYLPLKDMKRFGVTVRGLTGRRSGNDFRRLMMYETERTRRIFMRGRPLLFAVHGRLALELRLIWNGGMRVLEKVAADPARIFSGRPVLGRWDKLIVLIRALTMGR